jgi:segregation and condensation protein B
MDYNQIKAIIEGLLFAAGSDGLEAKQIAYILDLPVDEVVDLCYDLQGDLRRHNRGVQIVEIAGQFQMTTLREHAPYYERMAVSPEHSTLSQAALETLAIIAYRQPITRSDIEDIRGVKSEKAINTLTSKRLIREVGRAEGPGRPILYGTTKEFLDYFGLRDLSDLPPSSIHLTLDDLDEKERSLLEAEDLQGEPATEELASGEQIQLFDEKDTIDSQETNE